jgi:hypothetical protein
MEQGVSGRGFDPGATCNVFRGVLAAAYSTVTLLARFLGWSTSHPRSSAM